jgi:hypothetical protein
MACFDIISMNVHFVNMAPLFNLLFVCDKEDVHGTNEENTHQHKWREDTFKVNSNMHYP